MSGLMIYPYSKEISNPTLKCHLLITEKTNIAIIVKRSATRDKEMSALFLIIVLKRNN